MIFIEGAPGTFDPRRPPGTGAHGGIVGTSYGLLASPQAAKLVPSTVPPLPTEPASLGFGGGPIMIISPGAAAPRAARIGITRQALITAALHRVRPPGRRRCHASEIPAWPSRLPVGAHLCVRLHYMPPHIATACRAGACPRRPSSLLRKSPRPPEFPAGGGICVYGETGHRKTAPSSFSSSSRTDLTSSSASAAVRERSSERRVRLKATLFLPSGMGAPV